MITKIITNNYTHNPPSISTAPPEDEFVTEDLAPASCGSTVAAYRQERLLYSSKWEHLYLLHEKLVYVIYQLELFLQNLDVGSTFCGKLSTNDLF
jgi:hypothetical protein